MIPTELLYGLIGLAIPLVAARLGLPVPGPRGPDVRDLVRQSLLELLKGIASPKLATDDEIRKHLLEIVWAGREEK